jgi:hypothetical protein
MPPAELGRTPHFLMSDSLGQSRLHEAPRTISMKTRTVRDHGDIAAQAGPVSPRQATPTVFSQHDIDVDDRIVIAHESLALDTGSYSARWRRVRNVCLGELVDSEIGDLPDRSVILPRRAKFVVPGPKEAVEKAFASTRQMLSLIGLLINAIGLVYRISPLISFLIYLIIIIFWLRRKR